MADASIRWHDDLLSNFCSYALRSLKWIETNPVADADLPKRLCPTGRGIRPDATEPHPGAMELAPGGSALVHPAP